ncbi:MAG TPA: tetratricopeptide repeat protein, partial [Vicinamibacteria bacterium]|nr:tetratricopeptide repeat protein [Vicinamibacteria bacterium]
WLEAQQAARALPLFEKAVKREPKRLRAQALLGRAQLEVGNAAEAIVHLELARETDTDGSLHYQLARAYRATGQADRANEALRQFQEIQRAAAAESQSLKEEFQITPPPS